MMDKGYDGIQTVDPKNPDKNGPPRPCYLPHKARRGQPLTEEQKAFNAHLSRYRIVVEHSLAQMNRFQVLAQVYRHDRVRHSTLTRIVAGLVNRRTANRPLKTSVSPLFGPMPLQPLAGLDGSVTQTPFSSAAAQMRPRASNVMPVTNFPCRYPL